MRAGKATWAELLRELVYNIPVLQRALAVESDLHDHSQKGMSDNR
jgi:hypothetical protein